MNEPTFTQISSAFAMTCEVEINIQASAETVWRLLSDAKGFPHWNSTVTGIDGEIREGERLRLHVPGTTRTFTPRVSNVVPESGAWCGAMACLLSSKAFVPLFLRREARARPTS